MRCEKLIFKSIAALGTAIPRRLCSTRLDVCGQLVLTDREIIWSSKSSTTVFQRVAFVTVVSLRPFSCMLIKFSTENPLQIPPPKRCRKMFDFSCRVGEPYGGLTLQAHTNPFFGSGVCLTVPNSNSKHTLPFLSSGTHSMNPVYFWQTGKGTSNSMEMLHPQESCSFWSGAA